MQSERWRGLCVNWQFDIDDILRVAEQRNVEELKNSATDQLLSQFKVSRRQMCLIQYCSKDIYCALPARSPLIDNNWAIMFVWR